MSRMDTDESPVGAAPKETPGGSPGNAHETEKPCKGDPVPAANGRARSRVAPTGLVGFSALPQVSTWGFKEGRPRRGLFKARKDFQKPRRGEIAQRRASELVRAALRNPYRKMRSAGARLRERTDAGKNLPQISRIHAENASSGRNKRNPMRDAKRALGEPRIERA